MKQKSSMDPLLVQQIRCDEEAFILQSKAELTLVYVQEGQGITQFDAQAFPFQQGKLFLIPFDTRYVFQSDGLTRFLVVGCPQSFITQIRLEADRIETCDNLHKLTYITHHFHTKAGCVFRNPEDGELAAHLLKAIERESANPNQDYLIIRQGMAILLNLVARNLIQSDFEQLEASKREQDVMKLITYIQKNCANRQKVTIEALSETFGIAKSYLGEYVKKHLGISLQEYILDYKFQLAEIRLKHSTMRLKEIAFELDFNDESHFSKLFKKYKGVTPSKYRALYRQ